MGLLGESTPPPPFERRAGPGADGAATCGFSASVDIARGGEDDSPTGLGSSSAVAAAWPTAEQITRATRLPGELDCVLIGPSRPVPCRLSVLSCPVLSCPVLSTVLSTVLSYPVLMFPVPFCAVPVSVPSNSSIPSVRPPVPSRSVPFRPVPSRSVPFRPSRPSHSAPFRPVPFRPNPSRLPNHISPCCAVPSTPSRQSRPPRLRSRSVVRSTLSGHDE